jgi:hypothetical protein
VAKELHMDQPHASHPDRQLQFLRELVAEHTCIDADPFEIDEHSWAIHGAIPYGGEVPMAVFSTYEEALEALDGVSDPQNPGSVEENVTLELTSDSTESGWAAGP